MTSTSAGPSTPHRRDRDGPPPVTASRDGGCSSLLVTRPGVAAVTLRRDGGGIAYASRLVQRAIRDASREHSWLLTLEPGRYDGVTLAERASFAARLVAGQLVGRADWMLFTHLNLARLQPLVPAPVRRPYGVMLHDVEAWDEQLPADRVRAMSLARLRLANSGYTAARVMRAHPAAGEVLACPLALLPDTPEGGVDTPMLGTVGDRGVLLTGRMSASERYKGHDELIEAWPAVLARVPDARLVFVGLGDDTTRLQDKATRLGVADAVLFAGFVNDATLSALYARCALFAMPSRREGFGLVYLEAMRAGVPCIASRADAAGDTVVDSETGVLVDGQDPRDIAHAILGFLTNETRRRTFGEAGRRRFERLFTFERFADRFLPILRHAFEGAGR